MWALSLTPPFNASISKLTTLKSWFQKISYVFVSSYTLRPISELHRHALFIPSSSSYHPSLNFIDTLFFPIIFKLPLHTTQIKLFPTIFDVLCTTMLLKFPKDNLDTEPSYVYTLIQHITNFEIIKLMIYSHSMENHQFKIMLVHSIIDSS